MDSLPRARSPHARKRSRARQRRIEGEQPCVGEHGGCQQVGIDPANATTGQSMRIHKGEHVLVIGNDGDGESGHQPEDFAALAELAARQFTDHEGMSQDLVAFEQREEGRVAGAQVIDPN